MATIDDILKKYQKALTKKQIEDLIQKSEQYKLLNAGNRANAQTQLAKQYRQTRRGLQNMGLAGREGKLLSGREIGVKDAYRNAYGTYNQQLQQSESAMLEKDAARKAAATIRARQRQVELQQKAIDYEKERFNQEQITDPRLSMEKPTLSQTKKTVVNTDNVDPRFASQIEAPVKSQVADYRHFVNQVEDLEKAREQYRQAKEYVDNYTPKSQRDYIGRRKYAEAKNLVNQYDAYVNGDKRARFAVEYNVDLDRVSVDDPETARKLGSNVEYWYNLIDQNSQQWDYAIKNHTHDEASALERKANAYSNLSRIALAAKAPKEYRHLYMMSDAEFETAYDAAEKSYKNDMDTANAISKTGGLDLIATSNNEDRANNLRKSAIEKFEPFEQAKRLRELSSEQAQKYSLVEREKKYEFKYKGMNYVDASGYRRPIKNYDNENSTQNSLYAAIINEYAPTVKYAERGVGTNEPGFKQMIRDLILEKSKIVENEKNGLANYDKMFAVVVAASFMTEDEVGRYNTILGRYGEKEADKYFEFLYKTILPERVNQSRAEGYDNMLRRETLYDDNGNRIGSKSGKDTWLASATSSLLSVPMNLVEGAYSPIHTITRDQQDPFAAQLSASMSNNAQNIRNAVQENFGFWGGAGYGTGMSMLDSAFAAWAGGAIGGALAGIGVPTAASIGGKTVNLAQKAGSTIGGALLGGSAFNSTYQEALERGLTPNKARATAFGSGINEMLFESLSLDMLVGHFQKGGILKVSKNGFVNWVVNTLVQGGVEGSEEVFTDIGNNIWDKMINGIYSEELTKLREYVSQGMSFEEAKRKVSGEFAAQLGMSFAGGFASGGVMGGGSTFLGMMQNRGFERYGARMDADAKAEVRGFNFKDEQMQELAKQSKLTNQDYGVLAAAMLQQQFEEGRTYVQNALKDGTITKAQKELYDKYAQMAKDGKLTADVVASEEYAQDMDKLEPVFDIMDEGELIQQGMRDLAEAQRAVRDENAKYDKQVAAIENDTTLTDEQKQQKLDAIENERGEKVVEKVRDLEKVQKKYDENVKAENGKVETKRGNLTYDFSTAKTFNEMSDRQKSAIRFAKLFADKYGMNIKVVDDSVAGERIDGEYNSKTNTITVNIRGSNSVMYTVSHEVTHWLQENQSKAYNTLKGAIEKELSKTDLLVTDLPKVYQDIMGDYKTADNTVMDALVKYEQDMYKRQTGETLSKELAEDEVVARCCESFLKDRGFAQKMVAENPGTARTIAAKLRQLANDMKTLNEDALERGYEKYGDLIDSSIEKAALEQIGDIEKIARMWENALNQAAKKAAKKSKESGTTQYSLSKVAPVMPTSNAWQRTLDTDEAKRRFPTLWDVAAEESEVRNPTQIKSTVSTYRKIYDILKAEGFDGTILDASSGLGYGTRAGIEEYGYDVDDIEPYPDKSYKPKYTDYSTLNKKYDVIISNAVLNVIPQDQRDALVVKMGQMLNDGGRIFINTRSKDVDTLASNKSNTKIGNMEWFVSGTGSYQKGFTPNELQSYVQDALGDGFTVVKTNKFGAASVIVTKNSVQYSTNNKDSAGNALSDNQAEYFKDSKARDKDGNLMLFYHGTNADFTVFDRSKIGSTGRFEGSGFNFTPYEGRAKSYGKNVLTGYLNITHPLSADKKTLTVSKLAQLIREVDPTGDNIIANYANDTRDYGSDTFIRRESINTARNILQYSANDVDVYSDISSADPDAEGLIAAFEKLGYDGVIHYDDNGRIKTAVVFSSNQFKNAENKNPTKNVDVRYSLNNKVASMNIPSLSINDSTQAFTQQILDGEKDIETRTQPIPNSIVGKWIPIIRTGKGKQTVVGYVKFSGDKVYNSAKEFDADYKYHLVGKDSPYYKDGKKYGWIISDVVKLDKPIEIGTKGYKPGDFTFRDLDGIIDDPNASNLSQKAKAKFVSKSYDRNGYARHLTYRYRGREYMITDENNGYSEPMSVKHKNEQERIDREIEELVKERREGRKEQKYEGSAQEGFDLFWDYVENGEDRFSLNDKEYLALASKVKDGTATDADKAVLQKQVDAVAKENGYTIKAFHGTSSDFTKFDRGSQGKNYRGYLEFGAGFYFTPSEKEAQEWAKTSENKNGGNAHVMGVYLNPKRIIAADAPVPGGAKYLQGLGIEKGTAEFIAARTYRFINALIEERGFTNVEAQETLMALGYDAIDATFANGTGQYVVYDPSQIKSADIVTYDDKHNIIPLSERFDENRDDTRYSMNDKDFVLKKKDGEKWYELRDAKAKLYGSSVEIEGGSLLNRVRMMQNLAEMYGSVTTHATSEKEAETFKRAGAQRVVDPFVGETENDPGTWEFTHTENKYEQDTRYDAKQKRNFANAVLKEVGTFRNFKKEDLRIIRARLEKAFAVLHNAWHGDGDQLVAMEYADKLFDAILNRYTEMSEADAEMRDAILAEIPSRRDAKGHIIHDIEVTAAQMAEIKHVYGSVAAYNQALTKALGTRVYVKEAQNAQTLEDVFANNPYLDATTNEGDMPTVLLERAQETVGKRTNPYKADSEERAALKEAMFEKALTIVGIEKSTAQKVREAVKQARAEERAKAKDKTANAVAKVRAEERAKARKREAKLKEVTQKKIANLKVEQLRRDVKTIALKWNQRLVKMLANPTEASHIPVQLAREVAEFTDALTRFLDSGTQRGQINLAKIAKAYQQAFDDQATIAQAKAENPKYDPRGQVIDKEMFDQQLVDMMDELNTILQGKSLKDLNPFELRMLLNTVRGVAHTVYEANRMIGTTERKAIWQVGDKMVSELENAPKIPSKLRGYLETSLDLRRLAKIFSGSNENAEFVKLVEQLNKGAIEKVRIAQTLQSIFKPVTDRYGDDIRKWYGKNAEWIDTGITKNGKKVEITKGMRVSLALHVLNEGNMRHIENGGLTIPNREMYRKGKLTDAYANGDLVRLNAEQINEIISHMTDAEKAYVEAAKELFHKRTGYFINKTSLALLGYRKAMVENYFPIHTDKNFTKTDFASLKMDGSIEGQGFLKERVNATNPVYLEDITSVVNRQIRGVALYAGLAIPMRNFNAVMNASIYEDDNGVWSPRTTVKQTLTQKMGDYGRKVVEGFLSDVSEMSHVDVTPMERLAGRMAKRYVQAVLLMNLKVSLKQVASYPTAAAVIPWKYLGKALLAGGRNHRLISRADVDLINQYTPLYQMRREGMANEIASIMQKRGIDQKLPALMGWITKFDVATVGRLWTAAEYMVADQQKNLPVGSDAYYQAVAQVFNDTVQQTQPNFTPLQRNAALRSKSDIVRSLVLFGTQRMQNGGILTEAAFELMHSKGKSKAEIQAAKQKFGRAVASQIVQNVLLIAANLVSDIVRGRMKTWQDDDKEITVESLAKAMGDMFLSNFVGSFLGGSEVYDLVSALYKKATGGSVYDIDFTIPAVDSAKEILNFVKDTPDIVAYLTGDHTDQEKLNKAKNWSMQLAKVFGYATGIPIENAVKDLFKGIIPAIKDIADWNKTGELIPWLHQSGKLDQKKTSERYKEWTALGKSGREFFYWDNKMKGVTKRDDRIAMLANENIPNEDKAMLVAMFDTSGAYAEGTKVYRSNGNLYYDFADEKPASTVEQTLDDIAEATAIHPAESFAEPTATPKPLSDAKMEGVQQAVAQGVPEQTAVDAFVTYQNIGQVEGRDEEFREWLFKNVDDPHQRAVLEYQVIGRAAKFEGAITYKDNGTVYRDYTDENWYKLSQHKAAKDGTNKRYEAGKQLEKTGLSVDKTVAIYDGLKDLTKKAEWTEYLKKQGLTDEQIQIFLWSRGWAKLK